MRLIRAARRPVLVTVALLSGVLVAGALSTPTAARRTIDIRYSRFVPDALTVPAGEPVVFLIRNRDPIEHEWIVGDEALHERHRTGTEPHHGDRPTEQSIAALGEVRTMVTFDTPGTYRMVCHLPGHEAYGMVGTITVTD
jgi:uncharacterized cupredoxin-like copper-binding protein